MTQTNIDHDAKSSPNHAGPAVFINILTPKPGKLDELIAVQTAAQRRFFGMVPGLLGHRLHRALDGKTAVVIAVFETIEHHKRWLETDLFAEHLRRVGPLIERSDRGYFEVISEAGTL